MSVIFGVTLVDGSGATGSFCPTAGEEERTIFKGYVFDSLIFILTYDHGFADKLGMAERIRLFKTKVLKEDVLDLTEAFGNTFLAGQTVISRT